jgi:hypothetical protein
MADRGVLRAEVAVEPLENALPPVARRSGLMTVSGSRRGRAGSDDSVGRATELPAEPDFKSDSVIR